jgi:alanine dehydrogenase
MRPEGTLCLTRQDVSSLLTIGQCIEVVERVFRMYGEGKTVAPGILGVHARDGGFHIKAGLLDLERAYFAAKVNANFPQNESRYELPLIQGLIVLCDADNGYPLAVMDSIEITIQRTGAATAVAAKYLARSDSAAVTICGCGNQGRVSLKALSEVVPVKRAFAYDADSARAEQYAREMSSELSIEVKHVEELGKALKDSDICVTCTPSTSFFLKQEQVAPGTFIAAVGADSETKQELEPALLSRNKVVVDVLEQCAVIGELHHAIDAGVMTRDDVAGQLGEVVAGIKPGRTSAEEIIIFDSTGMALQDVITAASMYERAQREGVGRVLAFA